MALPWKTLHSIPTKAGPLELRQRGPRDFLITIAGRVLMTSAAHRSEDDLARAAISRLPPTAAAAPRILIGGLGMGYTLRAALDNLPATAQIRVCELNPDIAAWCRGPLAVLTDCALDDPRVTLHIGDVAADLRTTSRKHPGSLDAVILDLYEGPHESRDTDPLYGLGALADTRTALAEGGVLSVWSEEPDAPYEKRLERGKFTVTRTRTQTGGRRHVVYLARR